MHSFLFLLGALLLLSACRNSGDAAAARPLPERSLLFAFYNLENAWTPADDPATSGDDEFTPAGRMKWTQERLDRKLAAVGRVLRLMGWSGPDVLGVCEIENAEVLHILAKEHLPPGEYAVVHAESPDERGIDVALLYRTSAMKLVGMRMHRVDLGPGMRPTRDIMAATFEKEGRRFTVLANHWPSKRGGDRQTAPLRERAARTAAAIIDSLVALDRHADIVLMGDLNDVPASAPVTEALDAHEYREGQTFAHRMINTAAPVARIDTIGSYFYRENWETIDQIMVASGGALDSSGLMLYESSQTVFAPEFLRDAKADPVFRPPYRTYVRGTLYIGGASDHFPVMLRMGWK